MCADMGGSWEAHEKASLSHHHSYRPRPEIEKGRPGGRPFCFSFVS